MYFDFVLQREYELFLERRDELLLAEQKRRRRKYDYAMRIAWRTKQKENKHKGERDEDESRRNGRKKAKVATWGARARHQKGQRGTKT